MIRYLNEDCGSQCGNFGGCCPSAIVGPQGPVGPAGPQGEPGESATNDFITVANATCQLVEAGGVADLGEQITQGGSITYTATDSSVNLTEDGSYLVTLTGSTCGANEATVGVALAVNGDILPYTVINVSGSNSSYSVTTAVTATAPTVLTVVNSTDEDVNLENITLTVVRLA